MIENNVNGSTKKTHDQMQIAWRVTCIDRWEQAWKALWVLSYVIDDPAVLSLYDDASESALAQAQRFMQMYNKYKHAGARRVVLRRPALRGAAPFILLKDLHKFRFEEL